ncbi:hypothetical protein ACNHUS_02075 [Actinomycetes bacterium M1A6_2h]
MTQARKPRQFSPTEHLASEAVAAYVDGELRMNAYLRAAHHVSQCSSCAAEVDAQQQARGRLRASSEVSMPHSLLGVLNQIPHCTPQGSGESALGDPASKLHGLGSVVSARFRRK